MTLQEFFNLLSANPAIVLFYFIALPLTAFLSGIFGKGEGHMSPWKYVYCGLLYMAAVPGIFAVILNVYLFLFERQRILDSNIYTQILPIIAMVVTFLLIRRNVDIRQVPGFGRLSGLILVVTGVLAAMWILDRTRIFAITVVPFHYVIFMIIGLFVLVRVGWNRLAVKES